MKPNYSFTFDYGCSTEALLNKYSDLSMEPNPDISGIGVSYFSRPLMFYKH